MPRLLALLGAIFLAIVALGILIHMCSGWSEKGARQTRQRIERDGD